MARSDALLKLHKNLANRRNELLRRLGGDLEALSKSKNGTPSGDAADAAFDHSGEEIASQLAELESRELHQIERAILRLKQGTYGKCEGCGCKIPVARLSALPYSTLCISCQREAENDSDWLEARRAQNNWEQLSAGGDHEDKEVNLSDLELDLSK